MPGHLLTSAQMAEADRLTIAGGIAGFDLMERAGAAVARAAARLAAGLHPAGRRIAVLCGPGNNGGDGFVAARLLHDRGFAVSLGLLGERPNLRGDAALAAAKWDQPVLAAEALDLASADVIVDALFGAGLTRDLSGAARAIVERAQGAQKPVLAVDLPSGIDGDTGRVRGVALPAAATVTFFRRKPGHLLMPGRMFCGAVLCADIGILPDVLPATGANAFVNHPNLWGESLAVPRVDGHKYARGHALVLSGAMGGGAARLAARGALRAGAGLVTIASPPDALAAHAAQLNAIMLTPCAGPDDLAAILADARKSAVVMGPALGIGAATRQLVETALGRSETRAFVLDADALTSFGGDAGGLASLIAKTSNAVAITPHDGEFANLFKGKNDILNVLSKLERTRAAARFLGATVILKGPDTVVAHPDGRAAIGCDLPPWLATAGSGDVLAGIIGGLCAQAMPMFEAACCGVWLHGAAGREKGVGLIAEDLPEALPAVFRDLLSGKVRS